MNLTLQTWQKTLQTVYQRSAADAYFRQKCLSDPRAVVKEVSGMEMPPAARFRFVEQVEEITYVLPPRQAAGDELSDADLARVTGGAAALGYHACMLVGVTDLPE
ncbi:MAG TPA: hypothetical protein VHH73_07000 [Verrucomicrobiae bacterium]|nr:hypothetical protein [Verrucomicrobiae bacterium]